MHSSWSFKNIFPRLRAAWASELVASAGEDEKDIRRWDFWLTGAKLEGVRGGDLASFSLDHMGFDWKVSQFSDHIGSQHSGPPRRSTDTVANAMRGLREDRSSSASMARRSPHTVLT